MLEFLEDSGLKGEDFFMIICLNKQIIDNGINLMIKTQIICSRAPKYAHTCNQIKLFWLI